LSFGLSPAVAVDRVTFSNAKWGSRPDMMRIKSLRAELALLPLLFGDIRIKQVILSGADILLETRADGLGNWVLLPSEQKTTGLPILPTFDKVQIRDSVLVWRDRRTGTERTVKIDRLRTDAAAASESLKLNLKGSYNGKPVKLTGQINSLATLTSNKPTAVRLSLSAGGAQINVKGQIKEPITGAGLKISLSATGKDIKTLSGLAGTTLPSIGPYNIAANIVMTKSRWRLEQVQLKIGKSDLSGDAYIDANASPVLIVGNLQSALLRTDDFQEKKSTSKARNRSARTQPAERLFSADPISFSGLNQFSAKLSLKAKFIHLGEYAFEKVSLSAAVRKGRLILRPVRAKFEGGDLKLILDLSPVGRRSRLKFKADVRNLDLSRLVKRLGHPGLATGLIYANTSLYGEGASIRSIMARLDGHFITMMMGGRINNKRFTRLSGETLAAILPWSSGDRGIPVKCLVGQYAINKGRLVSNVTLLDTDRLLVRGEGGINLATEIIDFTISPKAKEASLVNLLVPIKIDGKLSAPEVYADPAGVAKNALGFATGGILANGLVSEIIGSIVSRLSGTKEGSPCLAAVTEIKNSVSPAKKKTRSKSSKKDGETMLESIGDSLKSLFSR
ncbi:MAG: AsmA family protein, partial [Proteobacteria bacterium]|nr:AsmA family protein [Pseudomonadota bacterium]